ncbi:MAG: triose-phosphate isomerase [Nitrospinaceae bacterium]|nr:triose-phosphate isomerase [Nitrospinaceae bacterium]
MRKPLVAGNWKMNKMIGEARVLAGEVAKGFSGMTGAAEKVEVVLGPPSLALPSVADEVAASPIAVAGQNCSSEEDGAFTGEVSASMLKDAGATHVILGHSERRELYAEEDAHVAAKASAASGLGLIPIICLGESLTIREAGGTLERIAHQMKHSIFAAFESAPEGLVIAYEPIWAIGTGVTASPEQAQEVHAFIRAQLKGQYGVDYAEKSRILYGGSMKPGNAGKLMAQPDIDGGLIGGASLVSGDFLEIIRIAQGV